MHQNVSSRKKKNIILKVSDVGLNSEECIDELIHYLQNSESKTLYFANVS